MYLITTITDQPNQNLTLLTDTNESVSLNLFYKPTQSAWFFNLSSGNFNLNGYRCSNSPNMIRKYVNQIDYGLACISNDLVDPFTINDFYYERSRIYLLNSNDVANIENQFFK